MSLEISKGPEKYYSVLILNPLFIIRAELGFILDLSSDFWQGFTKTFMKPNSILGLDIVSVSLIQRIRIRNILPGESFS